MTLKAVLDNLDGVDDALKPFYSEKDGKFALVVEGMVHESDVNGLKTALVKERENVSAFKKLGTPQEIAAKIAELEAAASKAGGKTADQEAILTQLKADYESRLAESEKRFSGLRTKVASAELKSELAKVGVVPEGLDLLAMAAASRIQFNDDGSPKIMAADGSVPMIGNGANGGATLSDLAKELAKSIPHLVKDGGAGGSGKQPGQNGGKPEQKTVARSAWDKMNPVERSEHVNKGGTVVDD